MGGRKSTHSGDITQIIERNSRLPVWFLEKGAETSKAVGRVVLKRPNGQTMGYGTGFLIQGGLFVTCHPVIPNAKEAQTAVVQFDYRVAADGSFSPLVEFALDPLRFFASNRELDTTVVAITSPNATGVRVEDRKIILLEPREDQILVGESVQIIHHPGGEPLSVALEERAIAIQGDFLHYAGDTFSGFGAPVLNSNWELIGLHHSLFTRRDAAGQMLSRDGSVWDPLMGEDQIDTVAKEAIRASSIKRWLDTLAAPAPANPTPPVHSRSSGRAPLAPPDHVPRKPRRPPPAPPATISEPPVVLPGKGERPVRDSVFVSYARADQQRVPWFDRLNLHLRQIPRLLPRVWDDSRIETGADWRQEIEYGLARAKAAVLLVGPNFLVSRFVLDNELPPLLKAAKEEGVRIFPLITDPAAYEESILGQFQSFNDPKKYLSKLSAPKQNERLLEFARAVAKVFQPEE
jgi:hypothetical protein